MDSKFNQQTSIGEYHVSNDELLQALNLLWKNKAIFLPKESVIKFFQTETGIAVQFSHKQGGNNGK